MKKLLGIVVLGLMWSNISLADSKSIIFLECEADYSINLSTGVSDPSIGKFTFRINKEKEVKTLNGTVGLTATKSEGGVKLYFGSSDDDNYSFQGFDNLDSPEVLFIETININRINGQLANHVRIFKNISKKKEEDKEKPDAELIHYFNCKIAEQKF